MNHTHQINTSSNSNSIQLVFENPSDEKKKKKQRDEVDKKNVMDFNILVYCLQM